jgi:hypothetical protein
MGILGVFTDVMGRLPEDGPGTLRGLDLAESVIEGVITTISREQDNLDPVEFEDKGYIAAGSFGGADQAPGLALHHTRAHGVTADTLTGVKTDLENFQVACRLARQAIVDADQEASDRIRYTQVAVDQLAFGARTNHGEQANSQAQRTHQHDRATDRPAGEES